MKKQLIVLWLICLVPVYSNICQAQPDLEISGIFFEDEGQSYAIINGRTVKVGNKIDEAEIIEISQDSIKFKYKDDIIIKKVGLGERKQRDLDEFDAFLKQNNIVKVIFEGHSYTLTEKQAKKLRDDKKAGDMYYYALYSRSTLRRVEYCFKNRASLNSEKTSLILDGIIRIGMNKEEVVASWGQPKDINRTVTSLSGHEQWVYDDNDYLYFEDGILTSWQDY